MNLYLQRILKLSRWVAIGVTAFASQTQPTYAISPPNRNSWYDVNEDGNFEVISWNAVYSINSSTFLSQGVFGATSNLYTKYSYGFADFNFDGKTDIFGHYQSSYGRPSIWLNDSFEAIVPTGSVAQIIPLELYGDGRVFATLSNSRFLSNGTDLSSMPSQAYSIGENNQLRYTSAAIMTLNQYNGLREELKLSKGGEGIPGWGDMFEHTTNEMWGGSFIYQQVDINGDGFMDYVNDKGTALIFTGDNSYVVGSIAPSAQFRDLNADGFTDYAMVKDNSLYVYIVDPKGNNPKEDVVLRNIKVSKFWIRDYNKDGHPDIIAIGGADSQGFYIIALENKGNGTFKKHENYVYGQISPIDCIDYNWNGRLDVLGTNSAQTNVSGSVIAYEIGLDGTASANPATNISNVAVRADNAYIFDPADNGQIAVFLQSDKVCFSKLGNAINSKPLPPSKPILNYDRSSGRLKISWDNGSDAESSAADLTYSLRIGTTPGGHEILNAHATRNGRRLNIIGGNNGYSRQRVLNTLTWGEGKYYISVQSVDPANRGSVFSAEAVFVKETPSSEFIISYDNELPGAGSKVYIETTATPAPGSVLNWDVDGATVLTSSSDKSKLVVKWEKGGKKHISLCVTSPTGKVSPVTDKTFTVEMANVVANGLQNVRNDFDFNIDGNPELIINGKIHASDANGEYSQLKKIFNQNLNASSSKAIDHNKDGYPDLVCSDNNNQLILNIDGEDMEIFDEQQKPSTQWLLADVDGDGFIEGVSSVGTLFEFGNSFECTEERTSGINSGSQPYRAIDFDRDGFIDIIAMGNTSDDNKYLEFWKNNNNSSFQFAGASATGESPVSSRYYNPTMAMDDFNGDGKPDFILSTSSYAFGVTSYREFIYLTYYGEDPIPVQCPDGTPFGNIIGTCDLDNNGLPDVIVELSPTGYAVVYMFPGNRFEVRATADMGSYPELYQTSDGKYHYGTLTLNVENAKPSAPTALRSQQSNGNVVVEWNHSVDKETPEANMRYNLSIKRKGASGEGAYIISPLNLGKNGIRPSSSQQLYNTNRVAISTAVLIPGEYEVMVQGVDLLGTASDFSQTYLLTVTSDDWVKMPTSGYVGEEIEIVFSNVPSTTPVFGEDARIISSNDGKYVVAWDNAGKKDISVNGMATASIFIHESLKASIFLPNSVLVGSTVVCNSDDIMYTNFTVSADGGSTFLSSDEMSEVVDIYIEDNQVNFTFNKEGEWVLFMSTNRPGMPELYYSAPTTVVAQNAIPQITLVNRVNTHYNISWTIPETLSSLVTGVTVYRKSSSDNSLFPIKTLPVNSTEFVDTNSDNSLEVNGYAIRYELSYGYSATSDIHIPTYLKLTTYDTQNGWNLTWNAYTGVQVAQYRILRGSSADNLTEIAIVDGSTESYLDKTAPAGELFYAVEIVPVTTMSKILKSIAVDNSSICSNVISTGEAITIVPATGILIEPNTNELNYYENPDGFLLVAKTAPLNATIRSVNWKITEGEELATITRAGRIYPTIAGNGIVKVKATTTDGSELTDEIVINVSDLKPYVLRDPIINPAGIDHKCYSEFYAISEVCDGRYCINDNLAEGRVRMDVRLADDGRKIYIPARKYGLFPKSEDITLHDVWVEGYIANDTLFIPSWQPVDIKENGKRLYLCAVEEGQILPAMKSTFTIQRNSDNTIESIDSWAPGGWCAPSFQLITNEKNPEVEPYHVHPHFFRTYYGKTTELPNEEDIVTHDSYKLSYMLVGPGTTHSRIVNSVVDKHGTMYIQGLFDIAPDAWLSFSHSIGTEGITATDWKWDDITDGYKYYDVGMADSHLNSSSVVTRYQPAFNFDYGMTEGSSKYLNLYAHTIDLIDVYRNYRNIKLEKIGEHSLKSEAPVVSNAWISTSDGLPLDQTDDRNPQLSFTIFAGYSGIGDEYGNYIKTRFSVDNRPYPFDSLGWQLYIDDQLIPFNQVYFPLLSTSYDWVAMTYDLAPYGTNEQTDFYTYSLPIDPNWRKVEVIHTINVNGDISESDRTPLFEFEDNSGVDSIFNDNPIISTEFFNLQGIRVATPAKGDVYIRKSYYRNGMVVTNKILMK